MIKKVKNVVKLHGYRFIFGISILSLALLVAWWTVFLTQSIGKQRMHLRENLAAKLNFFALQLGIDEKNLPETGVFEIDRRLEIAPCGPGREDFCKPLKPSWPQLCIRVREEALLKIEDEFKSKRFMLVGESSFLVLLVLLCFILLYKFIRLEKRYTKEIEEFWGRVTHEIKTPITGIKAFLQSLKQRSLNEEQLSFCVDLALKEVEKQEQLAKNILAGSTLRNKDVPLKKVNSDIGEFIETYFDGHVLHLSDAVVKFDIDSGRGLLVKGDPHALRIILDNITDNAVKYCSPGLILDIGISKQGSKAVIHIRDNGPGISAQILKTIFYPYKNFPHKLPTAVHGSGMGLFISRRLAEKMGGDLQAFSKGDGQGAEFRVFLPMVKKG
jgi:signal transduction histidine kinase